MGRASLANFKNRLDAPKVEVAEDGGILTEAQVQAHEQKKHDDGTCAEVETGDLGSQDTVRVGTLKAAGHVCPIDRQAI